MKGIIMSGDHPRKCQDGTKTMTRRVIKPQPLDGFRMRKGVNIFIREEDTNAIPRQQDYVKCPYGQVSDRLWVRETFSYLNMVNTHGEIKNTVWYWADGNPDYGNWTKPKPPIHMFKKDARIWLEITEVRVERVQEISGNDCLREGLSLNYSVVGALPHQFRRLWDSLNAKRGYSWAVNPFVWALSFKLIKSNERG